MKMSVTRIPRSADMETIGQFELTAGRLRASDPAYGARPDLAPVVSAERGTWTARTYIGQDDGDLRSLIVHRSDFDIDGVEWIHAGTVGVDSGAYCVADDEMHPATDQFLNACREIVHGNPGYGTLANGAVSPTGVGDGEFSCCVASRDGSVVAMLLGW